MVVVSCFEFMFCHTNVGPCVPRCCCDSSFEDNVLGKTRIKGAKVFVSTVAFLLAGVLVIFIKDLLIVAFDYISHVRTAAVADLEVVSIEYFMELV